MRFFSSSCAGVLLIVAACGSERPAEPSDIDLGPARTGFRCGAGESADAAACAILDEFAAAGPIREWPTGTEESVWLGVDHCVESTTTPTHAAYQLVFLRAGAGSRPLGDVAPERLPGYGAVFASTQVDTSSMPGPAAALASMASGATPDPATTGELWRTILQDPVVAYRMLVRAPSGISVGDGRTDGSGVWFLRSDGSHLLLVGPTIQGGCASKLYRIPHW